ncbi:Rieske (2Fe-2S) protein [Nocardia sp. alder85J]|uniref:Rieske (2Fe-2S) protein n=1 Tax=Nocardia sp. alder85J TaxID=2862949 RepID=UPI001CD55C7B|nr:Rieske 2Fe-2S domain-containing protein [Nocardia sp. alder85J]MCX4094665.1 Rieske 2Fe-2S domain-containing protein [Nocardia sp. alder85J]
MTKHIIGSHDDIPPGEGRAYVVEGRQIAVFRLRDGGLRALDAACPHRGGPLADGLLDAGVVVCPLHGHSFDLGTGADTTGGPPACSHRATREPDGTIAVVLGTAGSRPDTAA